MSQRQIVVFDGVCNPCNGFVQFIIARDPGGVFAFAPAQGDAGRALLAQYGKTAEALDAMFLIKDGACFAGSEAALEIAKEFRGFWRLLRIYKLIPRPIRDACYAMIANHRYRLFGRRGVCMVPARGQRDRFL